MMRRLLAAVVLVLTALAPSAALAWWNGDWSQRTKLTLDAGATILPVKDVNGPVPVLVRLHTGNFLFTDAKPDGSDLRFVAGDDKTPLRFHIESFDAANELATIWVQVPRLPPAGAPESIWLYYGNPKAPPADDAKGTYDTPQAVVLHYAEKDGAAKDATAYGNHPQGTVGHAAAGLIGSAGTFSGGAGLTLPASPSIKVGPAGLTFSTWLKADSPGQSATLFAQEDGAKHARLLLDQGQLVGVVSGGGTTPRSGRIEPGRWHHVAMTVAPDRVAVYLDGAEVGSAPSKPIELAGTVAIGNRFAGQLDETQLAYTVRPPGYIAAAAASEGTDPKLLVVGDAESSAGGSELTYFRILWSSLTFDAILVIAILMFMMLVSFAVMLAKALMLSRTERANRAFMERFVAADEDLFALEGGKVASGGSVGAAAVKDTDLSASTLYKLYSIGTRELRKRLPASSEDERKFAGLSPQSLEAIRASVDAGLVRENARLNARMVLLTIAISGGPFLGLLGTVVGVMITFAAIAAVGDVNVNAIAPGIAAALLATVAGLAVAIPCLFGYNWLASRIKAISADSQVFVDELVTRFAERYAP